MRRRVRTDDVAPLVKLTDLTGVEETATADEVRRDEAVPAPAAPLQTLRDGRVVRRSAVIHRYGKRGCARSDVEVITARDRGREDR